jgi:hypothetical protein
MRGRFLMECFMGFFMKRLDKQSDLKRVIVQLDLGNSLKKSED